jgi:hypothetical protein
MIHMEHTGGTTLREVLRRQYGERLYVLFIDDHDAMRQFMAMDEAGRARYAAFTGHFMYGLHRWVSRPSTYMTWLRDPVERILSGYYYFFHKPLKRRHQAYVSGKVTWERHLRRTWVYSAQVGRIVGGDDAMLTQFQMKTLPENATETALANLQRDFSLVGLTERYDEMLLLMAQQLGWTKPPYYVRQNVGQNRPRFADLPADDRALIEAAAEVEAPLYEYARRRFERDVARYQGDIERDLTAFRQANADYSARALAHQARVNRLKAPFRHAKRWLRARRPAQQKVE